jgi:hypothetical protein
VADEIQVALGPFGVRDEGQRHAGIIEQQPEDKGKPIG